MEDIEIIKEKDNYKPIIEDSEYDYNIDIPDNLKYIDAVIENQEEFNKKENNQYDESIKNMFKPTGKNFKNI